MIRYNIEPVTHKFRRSLNPLSRATFIFFKDISCFIENARCSNLPCPYQKKCLLDVKTGTPTCSDCSRSCSIAFHIPVCGTDGRTYSSYCHMRKVSCRKGILIRTRRAGACKGTKTSINIIKTIRSHGKTYFGVNTVMKRVFCSNAD